MTTLRSNIQRLQAIGTEIAVLSKESQKLRAEVAKELSEPNEERWERGFSIPESKDGVFRFICDGKLVMISRANGGKDFNVTFDSPPVLD